MERVRVALPVVITNGVARVTSQTLANLIACAMRWIGNPFGSDSSSKSTASFQSLRSNNSLAQDLPPLPPLQRPAPPPGRSPNHRPFYEGIDTEQLQNNIRERVILKAHTLRLSRLRQWATLGCCCTPPRPSPLSSQSPRTHPRTITHALTRRSADRERGETEADGCTCPCCKVTKNRDATMASLRLPQSMGIPAFL